ADDGGPPKLARGEPGDLGMDERARRIREGDERDVGVLGDDASAADRRHLRRELIEPVAQNRKVVRPHVPDHAHVGLVKAEIDAARGDEVNVSQLAGIDELLDRPYRRAVEERMARHQYAPRVGGYGHEVANLLG